MKPFALHMADYADAARQAVSGPIARSAISGMVLRLIGMALIFAQAVIAARLLGADGYGVLSIILSVAHVAATFLLFGLANLAIAEVPRLLARGGSHAVRSFVKYGFGRLALLSLVVLPATSAAIMLILNDLSTLVIAAAVLIVPLLAVLQFVRGVALGLERPIGAQLPSEIVRPSVFLIALCLAWWLYTANIATFLALYLATAALAALIALPSMKIKTAAAAKTVPSGDEINTPAAWDRAALPFLGLHLAAIFQVELATLLLGVLASAEAAGQFQPVARISVVLLLPIISLNLRFSPRISALHEAGQREDILRLSRKYTWASFLAMCAAGLAIGLMSPWLLALFGPEFSDGEALVWIIVLGRIAFTAFGPAALLLAATGNTKAALKATGLGLLAEAIIGVALILWLGLTGAALAVAIGLLIRGSLLIVASRRSLNIGLRAFWMKTESD